MFGQTLEGCLAVNIMSVKISTMRQDERWLAGYKEVMGVQEENLGDAHDAADVAVVQAHLIEAEERLRVGERSSGIEGFSQSPAFVSETFCTFAARK